MSEIKNNEKNIDNPPVKEEIKKPEDHKKQEDMGNNLDQMRSTGGTSLESKTAQSRITETPKQKEIKEDKTKTADVQDKKTVIGSKLENLSSTGTMKESEKDRLEKTEGVKEITKPYYDDARELAKKSEMGANFTDHTEDHVEQVAEKSIEAANALEKAIQKGEFTVENNSDDHIPFVGNIDKSVLEGAALSHDTGMRGDGYAVEMYEDENGIKRFAKDADGNFIVSKEDNGDFNQVRENHSLNSAINILADREKYKELGYTDEQVDMMAAECMAHSKSSSGVHNLNSKKDWKECFSCIDAVVQRYRDDHPGSNIDFHREYFENDDKKMGQLATSTQALRVGDVSRNSGPDAKSQSGDEVHVNRKTLNDGAGTPAGEVENADIKRGDEDISNEKSRKIHAGEQNITDNHTYCKEDGTLCHKITVNDGTSVPECTIDAITDHVKEFASGQGGNFRIEVEFDKPCSSETRQNYEYYQNRVAATYKNVEIVLPWDNKEDS